MAPKTPPVIEIKAVTKVFTGEGTATRALRGITFAIEPGQFTAIMGPSGSGKSTLLHILGLLDAPSSGTYAFAGTNTATLSEPSRARLRNTSIGFIFQAFHLLARTTVLENVMLPLQYSTLPPREHRPRALEALERVGLMERLQHRPSQLSGGEKQRVAIARALVNKPRLLLADEPTGNLDSKTGHQVMELMDELHQAGHTVVVITHETPTAEYAQRVIVLHDGQIASDRAVARRHRHYTK